MIRTSISIGGSRLSDNDFTSVELMQSIGSHHSFVVKLRQDANKVSLMEKTNSWMGKVLTIAIGEKEDRQIMNAPPKEIFSGLVTRLRMSRENGFGVLIVEGESPTKYLDDGINARSFTEMGLQEIVDKVMNPYGANFPNPPEVDPKTFKETIPYCVQYRESNFAFLNRLANQFGEWFYYDGLKLFFGKPSSDDSIKLDFGKNGLTSFDVVVKALPLKMEMQGYDYLVHKSHGEKTPIKTKSNELGEIAIAISTDDVFTETPAVAIQTNIEKSKVAPLLERQEQIALDRQVVATGKSVNGTLKIGSVIEVSDGLIGENYGSYVITKLEHKIGQGGAYNNYFTAIPSEVVAPPLSVKPGPNFCETQLAKVTNVDDDEGLGRIKVKFFWQENSAEESPWIRVASPYTGKDKGFYIIPEVDDQVLVSFENSNAELPYVLTGMYNGEAKPEWFEGKNRFKGFKSKGQNQWKFDDKNKSIHIDAPSSIVISAGKKITMRTGGKEDSEINIDVGDGTVNVVAKIVKVEAAETIEMNSKKEIIATATQTIKFESSKELSASGTQKVDIKGTEVAIEGSASSELKGAKVGVKGSALVEVKSAVVKLN